MTRPDMAHMKSKIAEHWNARAPMFEESYAHVAKSEREDEAWLATIGRYLPPGERLRVLDLGTGLGYLASVASRLGHDAYGIDIAAEMVVRANARCERLGIPVTITEGDADHLAFDDGSFDAVTERNVLWTMPRPAETLAEIRRVLRPGGVLLSMEAKWLPSRDAPVVTSAVGGAPNLMEHYGEFRDEIPLLGGATPDELTTFLSSHGWRCSPPDLLEEIWAARLVTSPELANDPASHLYLVAAR